MRLRLAPVMTLAAAAAFAPRAAADAARAESPTSDARPGPADAAPSTEPAASVVAADAPAAAPAVLLASVARPFRGVYGGLAMVGVMMPLGAGNELGRGCEELGAADCTSSIPWGGGFTGHVGIATGWLGYELFLGALGDVQRPSARYDGATHLAYGNPLLSNPRREETFVVLRAGVMLAPRVRFVSETDDSRLSLAVGPGLAWRHMALEREVTTDGGQEDRPYFSPATSYVSPALSLEASWQIRSTRTLAIDLGLGVWLETAWGNTRSVADAARTAAGSGKVYPLATPPYRMASGLQVLVLPTVGLAFGP